MGRVAVNIANTILPAMSGCTNYRKWMVKASELDMKDLFAVFRGVCAFLCVMCVCCCCCVDG